MSIFADTLPIPVLPAPHPAWCDPRTCRVDATFDARGGVALLLHSVVLLTGDRTVEMCRTDRISVADGRLLETGADAVLVTRDGLEELTLPVGDARALGAALIRASVALGLLR